MAATRKRPAVDRVLEVIDNADAALTAQQIVRIANSDTYRQAGEADLAASTVRNTLAKLTGIVKTKGSDRHGQWLPNHLRPGFGQREHTAQPAFPLVIRCPSQSGSVVSSAKLHCLPDPGPT